MQRLMRVREGMNSKRIWNVHRENQSLRISKGNSATLKERSTTTPRPLCQGQRKNDGRSTVVVLLILNDTDSIGRNEEKDAPLDWDTLLMFDREKVGVDESDRLPDLSHEWLDDKEKAMRELRQKQRLQEKRRLAIGPPRAYGIPHEDEMSSSSTCDSMKMAPAQQTDKRWMYPAELMFGTIQFCKSFTLSGTDIFLPQARWTVENVNLLRITTSALDNHSNEDTSALDNSPTRRKNRSSLVLPGHREDT